MAAAAGMLNVTGSGDDGCLEDAVMHLEDGMRRLKGVMGLAMGREDETIREAAHDYRALSGRAAPGYGGTAVDTPLTQLKDKGRRSSDRLRVQVVYVHSTGLRTHSFR